MNDSGKLIKSSTIFVIASVISKCINMLLMPVFTGQLSVEEYGAAQLVLNFVSSMELLIILGLSDSVLRFDCEYSGTKEYVDFMSTIVMTVFAASTVICSLMLIFNGLVEKYFMAGLNFYPYVFWGIVSLFLSANYFIYQAILQARDEPFRYALNGLCYSLLFITFSVILVCGLKKGAEGLVIAQAITYFLLSLVGLLDLISRKLIRFVFNRRIMQNSLKYSIPLLPHGLANSISQYIANYILAVNYTTYSVGIYSVATQISTPIDVIQNSMNRAFAPWYNRQMKEGENGQNSIRKMSELYLSVSLLISFCVAVFGRDLVYLLTPETYHAASKAIPLLAVTCIIRGFYYIYVRAVTYDVKRSKYLSIISLVSSLANIVLCSFFAIKLDFIGAGLALLLSTIIRTVPTVVFSKRIHRMNLPEKNMIIKTILILCAGALMLYIESSYIETAQIIVEIMKVILTLIIATLLFWKYRLLIKSTVTTYILKKGNNHEQSN